MNLYEVEFALETRKVIVITCLAESEEGAIKIGKEYTAIGEPSKVSLIPVTESRFLAFQVR